MGRWIEIQRAWHDTAVTNCALCGRLVPRRIWLVEIDGRDLPFCNEECEGLYRSYWLPKYGTSSLTPSPSPIPMGMGSPDAETGCHPGSHPDVSTPSLAPGRAGYPRSGWR